MKAIRLGPAVELRHRKIGRRLAQDLVGLAQLAVLTLERLDPLALLRARASPQAPITLGLANPVAQGLARAADLGRDRLDGRVLRAVLALVIQHHPDRALADLRRIGGCALRHGSILSRVGASGKPGTVQTGTPAPPPQTSNIGKRADLVFWSLSGTVT